MISLLIIAQTVFLFLLGMYFMRENPWSELIPCLIFAAFAFQMARERGIEVWANWTAGDAYDIAVLVWLITTFCRGRA